jgi:hypothetical protein
VREIDAKLIYRRIASQMQDKILQEGLAELQRKLLAEKVSTHLEPGKK